MFSSYPKSNIQFNTIKTILKIYKIFFFSTFLNLFLIVADVGEIKETLWAEMTAKGENWKCGTYRRM